MLKISKKNVLSKVLAIALSLVMTVSLGATSAFAATTDPNMTAFEGEFTIEVATNTALPVPLAFEATPADASFTPTFFGTQADAEATEWELVGNTGGINATKVGAAQGLDVGTDQFVSQQTVMVQSGSTPGAASFEAVNPGSLPADATVNFTVVLTDVANPDDAVTTVADVTVTVMDPNANSTNPTLSGTFGQISAVANPIDARSYVTV